MAILVAHDVTAREEARAALRERAGVLQETVEELHTTNEELQSTNEELVTANEEMQSANEELATLNEELQSTNEELETTNEELQSTNEELNTVNEEFHRSTRDVQRLSEVLRAIVQVTGDALIVCDKDQTVYLWNARAREFFGQREDEVIGRNVFSVGLPIEAEKLRDLMTRASQTAEYVAVDEIILREKRPARVSLTVHQIPGSTAAAGWVIAWQDRTREHESRLAAETAAFLYHAILENTTDAVLIISPDGTLRDATRAAQVAIGVSQEELSQTNLFSLTEDPGAALQMKGAVSDLIKHGGKTPRHKRHEIQVTLRSKGMVTLTFIAIDAEGAAPLVIVRKA